MGILEQTWVSQASATQRSGRAGRVQVRSTLSTEICFGFARGLAHVLQGTLVILSVVFPTAINATLPVFTFGRSLHRST